jgi:transcriptional regulator with XRE-family HTH domain
MDAGNRGMQQSERAARLMELLGLSEDELCRVLGVDALSLLSGQLDHRGELPILISLLDEASARSGVGPAVLRRWVRASGPRGRPIDALLARDFGAFEDAVAEFADRGFVIRGGGDG